MFTFHHVAVSVSDLETSESFYEALGFDGVLRWESPEGDLSIVQMRLDDSILELFSYRDHTDHPESRTQVGNNLDEIGVKHFGLRVPSLSEARDRLAELGVSDASPVTKGRTGIDYFFVKDPDGIWVEVVQDNRGL